MLRTETPRETPLYRMMMFVVVALLAGWAIGTFLSGNNTEDLRASVIFMVLTVVSLLLFWVIGRADPDGRVLFVFLIASFAAKLGALYFRFYTRLLADAFGYSNAGRDIAAILATGQWPELPQWIGTSFIRLLTGMAYFVLGETFYGVSILWAWFGLLGLLFFYKAFTTAFPQGHRRLYMLLIFLYPSMLLWTSSLGKDAPMVMFLGMAAFGAARLQRSIEPVGLWWLAAGIGGAYMIRPHMAAVVGVALAASMLTRPIHLGPLSPVIRMTGLLVVAIAAAVVVSQASGYVGLDSLEAESVFGFIEERQEQTEQGDAAFQQVDIRTPGGAALAIPTVLFRPFPWEAHNAGALVASIEGLGLLALIIWRWRSVWAAITGARRESYLLLILVYAALFIFFFSAIGNFGIIARQRVMLFPFIFMWIAYLAPAVPAGRKSV